MTSAELKSRNKSERFLMRAGKDLERTRSQWYWRNKESGLHLNA